MVKSDQKITLQKLKDMIARFREERGWRKREDAKNIALSLTLEAAELLEHFQWDFMSEEEMKQSKAKMNEIASEMADCFVYLFSFSDRMGIDIASAVLKKLKLTSKKYPLSRFNQKHQDIEYYYQVKKRYRGEK